MSVRTEVRLFEEDDREGMCALYGEIFGQDALDLYRRRWTWQFTDNPLARVVPSRHWIAVRNGDVVGGLGSFPARWKVFERELVNLVECDFFVSDVARRQDPTTPLRLLRASQMAPHRELTLAIGYTAPHGMLRERMGHKTIHVAPFALRPRSCRALMEYLRSADRLPGWLSTPPGSWALHGCGILGDTALHVVNRIKRPSNAKDYTVERVTSFGVEFDDLWRRASQEFPVVGVRDRQFLQWRFAEDPVWDHTVLAARNRRGELVGYIAVRRSSLKRLNMGRILDLFCSPTDTRLIESLLHHGIRCLEEEDIDLIGCLGMHPRIQRVIRRFLYWAPARFERPAFFRWQGPDTAPDGILDENNWHVSHADGDEGFSP